MLDTITLENFKAFKKLESMKIKPITVLCGTNSCGKSSILQSVLLAKQTLEGRNPNQTLLLNGRLVHLGAFDGIVFEKKVDNSVVLTFSFRVAAPKLFKKIRRSNVFHFRVRQLLLKELAGLRKVRHADYILHFKVSFKASKKQKVRSHLRQVIVNHLSTRIEAISKTGERITETRIEMNLKRGGWYEISWANLNPRYLKEEFTEKDGMQTNWEIEFANLFPIAMRSKYAWQEESDLNYIIFTFFARVKTILERILYSYTYIGPLREEPSRRYIYEEEIVEIGTKGENAAYLYLIGQDMKINNHYFYSSATDSFYMQRKQVTLDVAVNKWLTLMQIDSFRSEPINEIIYLTLASSSARRTRVNIADVGFGVSQIFPIVLEGLRMPVGSTLLLEQPEIHLHPNLQMQMADYLISLALSKKNVILETHSDHVVDRLIRRIVQDHIHDLKDMIAIYFIKPTKGGAIYEEVIIDERRGIVNWPLDFFDQTASEQQRILQAGLEKRKAARERGDK